MIFMALYYIVKKIGENAIEIQEENKIFSKSKIK
jgi:hypothetical protein